MRLCDCPLMMRFLEIKRELSREKSFLLNLITKELRGENMLYSNLVNFPWSLCVVCLLCLLFRSKINAK